MIWHTTRENVGMCNESASEPHESEIRRLVGSIVEFPYAPIRREILGRPFSSTSKSGRKVGVPGVPGVEV